MPGLLRWVLPFCLMLGILAAPATAQTTELMPVSEVREGMTGIGLTVIQGTAIEEFNIEVIGVLERGGFNGGPMILVRGWGDVLDRTGGFAGGYSGSPVYIENRMFGAISAAWFFADGSIAGVTPIYEMLKNLDYPDDNAGEIGGAAVTISDVPIEIDGREFTRIALATDSNPTTEEIAADAAAGQLTLLPAKTPLFVNGLNPQLIEMLRTELGPMMPHIEIMAGPGAQFGGNGVDTTQLQLFHGLQPGAAVGAQLVAGDIDMTAIGTLTYIDENHVLAFGHPFLQVGAVELPLTKARIVHTMKSIQRSFKMGEATHRVGKLNQDRAAAVSGLLGQVPEMIPFHLKITDSDLGRVRRYDYEVIDYEEILPLLGLMPPIQGLSEVMDRQGSTTIKSTFKILTDELEPIERTNTFYDQFSGVGLFELFQSLYLMTSANIFEEVTIREVFIEVEVTQNRQTTDIMKAEIVNKDKHGHPGFKARSTADTDDDMSNVEGEENPEPLQGNPDDETVQFNIIETTPAADHGFGEDVAKFEPGDTIEVEVTLKPYREDEDTMTLKLRIPDDMSPGQTTLEIRGGGRLPSIFQFASGNQFPAGFQSSGAPSGFGTEPPQDLQSLLDLFLEQERMNELVIELYRIPATTGTNGSGEASEADAEARASGVRDVDAEDDGSPDEEPVKTVEELDDVIYGSVMLPVEIIDPDAEEKVTETEAEAVKEAVMERKEPSDDDDSDDDDRQNSRDKYR